MTESSSNIYSLIDKLERQVENRGGSSDGQEPPMEARISKLEAAVEYIQRDIAEIKTELRRLRDKVDGHFIILAGTIIAAALGLAGIMAKGFGWL